MIDIHCPDLKFIGHPRELNWDHRDCLRRIDEQENIPEDLLEVVCANCPTGSYLYFITYLGG